MTRFRRSIALASSLVLPAIGAVAVVNQSVAAAPAAAHAATGKNAPGLAGKKLVLVNNHSFTAGAWDEGTDADGNTYIGWITTGAGTDHPRTVFLCTIKAGGDSCAGGVQAIQSLDGSTAVDLHVLVTPGGDVTLVWAANTTSGEEVVEATSDAGATAVGPTPLYSLPSNGYLQAAALGPDGSVWTVGTDSSQDDLVINAGSATSTTLHPPVSVGYTDLAFDGQEPVIVITKEAAITEPDYAAHESGGAWSSFTPISGTISAGYQPGLVTTKSGVDLITATKNPLYREVVASWNGSSFDKPTQAGDTSDCQPSSADSVTDASGRLADVADECGKIAIDNLPTDSSAGIVRFSAGGSVAGSTPQLATTPSGHGWAVYAIESSEGDKLLAAPVQLPAETVSRSKSSSAGRVTVTGPQSCLPAVSTPVGLTDKAASGWKVSSRVLQLGSTKLSASLNGASLKPGKHYDLVGTVVFDKEGKHKKVVVKLPFTTCPSP